MSYFKRKLYRKCHVLHVRYIVNVFHMEKFRKCHVVHVNCIVNVICHIKKTRKCIVNAKFHMQIVW